MRIKQYLRTGLYFTVLFFFFLNCSSSTDSESTTNATIEGTITLPAAAEGKVYNVVIDNDDDGLNGFVRLGSGNCGSSASVNYSVTDVPEGNYYISAVVYVVSLPGTIPTTGDYGGFYGSDSIPAAANATVVVDGSADFDFDLTVVP